MVYILSTLSRGNGCSSGACLEKTNGDVAFIAKALGDITRAKSELQVDDKQGCPMNSLFYQIDRL
jgi:hypothetical protein